MGPIPERHHAAPIAALASTTELQRWSIAVSNIGGAPRDDTIPTNASRKAMDRKKPAQHLTTGDKAKAKDKEKSKDKDKNRTRDGGGGRHSVRKSNRQRELQQQGKPGKLKHDTPPSNGTSGLPSKKHKNPPNSKQRRNSNRPEKRVRDRLARQKAELGAAAEAAVEAVLTSDQQTLCRVSSCEVSDGPSGGGSGDAHSAKRKREEAVQEGIDDLKLDGKKPRTEGGCRGGEVDDATTA